MTNTFQVKSKGGSSRVNRLEVNISHCAEPEIVFAASQTILIRYENKCMLCVSLSNVLSPNEILTLSFFVLVIDVLVIKRKEKASCP